MESWNYIMYEIAVCDDDHVFLSSFKPMLKKVLDIRHIDYHLSFFHDPSALLDEMKNGHKFHLLFLDIYYDTGRGLSFAKTLREKNDQTDIIFMTTISGYALECYDVAPLHYLLKPIDPKKLETAVTRFLEKNAHLKLHFMTANGHLYVPIADILYFEIYGHKIVIHLSDGTKESYMGTLKELERQLPDSVFARPYRSYLVNLRHITKVARYQIQLSSGDSIPVSKNLYNSLLVSLINYDTKQGSVSM